MERLAARSAGNRERRGAHGRRQGGIRWRLPTIRARVQDQLISSQQPMSMLTTTQKQPFRGSPVQKRRAAISSIMMARPVMNWRLSRRCWCTPCQYAAAAAAALAAALASAASAASWGAAALLVAGGGMAAAGGGTAARGCGGCTAGWLRSFRRGGWLTARGKGGEGAVGGAAEGSTRPLPRRLS